MASLIDFLRPEPVDPRFKAGGALHGFNEDLTLTVAALAALWLVDHLLVRAFLNTKSRWFAVHAFGNAIVVYFALPEVIQTLRDPLVAFSGPMASMVPNSTVTLLVALPFKQHTGTMNSFGTFFLCGLPGGLNYVLLVLVKEGRLSSLKQKHWDAHINTWMRGPSMAVFAFLMYQTWLYDKYTHAPLPAVSPEGELCLRQSRLGSLAFVVFVAVLHFWNGQYYNKMAVGNFYATRAKATADAVSDTAECKRA